MSLPERPSAKVMEKSQVSCTEVRKWSKKVKSAAKRRDKLCRSGEAAPIIPQNAEKVKKNLQKKGLIS